MRAFGEVIAEASKKANLTQRQLAARIKTEEGRAISGPYLNDIEHNLRHPPRGFLLEQFARSRILRFGICQAAWRSAKFPVATD